MQTTLFLIIYFGIGVICGMLISVTIPQLRLPFYDKPFLLKYEALKKELAVSKARTLLLTQSLDKVLDDKRKEIEVLETIVFKKNQTIAGLSRELSAMSVKLIFIEKKLHEKAMELSIRRESQKAG